MTSISFILPYYRLGRKLLDRAVDSILNARLACDYEIIVVDDGTPCLLYSSPSPRACS